MLGDSSETGGSSRGRSGPGTPVHREDDGELLGYLVAVDSDTDRVVPVSVFGSPLVPVPVPVGAQEGEQQLLAAGLGYLAERWEWQEPGKGWVLVELVEADPAGVLVQIVDMNQPDRYGQRHRLVAPVGGQLRRR